jgi:hypothetical protein
MYYGLREEEDGGRKEGSSRGSNQWPSHWVVCTTHWSLISTLKFEANCWKQILELNGVCAIQTTRKKKYCTALGYLGSANWHNMLQFYVISFFTPQKQGDSMTLMVHRSLLEMCETSSPRLSILVTTRFDPRHLTHIKESIQQHGFGHPTRKVQISKN